MEPRAWRPYSRATRDYRSTAPEAAQRFARWKLLRDANFELPDLNFDRGGEEADLSWVSIRLIIEIDGGPFHLDRGQDERKQRVWETAGWALRRIASDDIYDAPQRLIALAAAMNVPRYAL